LRVELLAILRLPLRPEIGSVRSADLRPLVPGEPQPAHAVEDRRDRLVRGTGSVRVLDPQDERASPRTGEEEIEQRRARPTHVEIPGGARRKPNAHAHEDILGVMEPAKLRAAPKPVKATPD